MDFGSILLVSAKACGFLEDPGLQFCFNILCLVDDHRVILVSGKLLLYTLNL